MVQSVSIETVMSMISRNHKGVNYSPDDIGQWCGECVEEIGCFEALELVQDEEVELKNGLGALPCSVYRLLKTEQKGVCIPNVHCDAPYIRIKGFTGKVKVDYLRVPLDEKGYPKIDAVARQACYYYCLQKLKYDDFLNQKLSPVAWADITENVTYYQLKAKGSMRNVSIDDTNRLSAVMFNITKSVVAPRNY